MDGKHDWFAPKRFGFGAGLPIAWQGWAVLAALGLAVAFAIWLFGRDDWRALAIILPAVIATVLVASQTTKGGWRWRWSWRPGEDD